MEPALQTLAHGQGGVFTTPQARALGLGDRHLARMRRDRVITPIARSVSMLGSASPTQPDALLALRTRGALALYPDARAVGASAVVELGLPLFGVEDPRADIVRPVRREVVTELCRIRPPHPLVRRLAAPTPGREVAEALVQLALDHGHVTAVVAADRALHDGTVTVALLEEVAREIKGWPDAARVRTMLAYADGRAESVGESRLRLFVRALGWAVTPQAPVVEAGRVFAYADLGVDGTNLLLEFDGRVKYASDPDALWKEKRREDRARRQGWVFERVIWSELDRPELLVPRLLAAKAAAGPPPGA
jgi:hypothetical protein